MAKVLFAVSEAYPLIKTGGLGDVAGSLPRALTGQGCDVRLLLPAYTDVLNRLDKVRTLTRFTIEDYAVTLLHATLPHSRVPCWLVQCDELFNRPGNPYLASDGQPWPDNAERFALFARVGELIALDKLDLQWQPDIVHCHDWQSGLLPALLAQHTQRPRTVFTIHNLAYPGLFPHATFVKLKLPAALWSHDALEFHGQLSFIKGGLVFADRITTVSPTYAQEIQTPTFGYGLDGLLRHRQADLVGIVNGIDENEWNPWKDPHLSENYNSRNLDDKRRNKLALQREFGLPQDAKIALFGLVGRLVEQKGIDLIIDLLPQLTKLDAQFVFLGTGQRSYEQTLQQWAGRHTDRIGVRIGYNEALAHHIEAGADIFLMPSRFEPCGLNQLYSLRYGTVPLVHNTGGLADTVVDANDTTLDDHSATGLSFSEPSPTALMTTVQRGLRLYADEKAWRQLQKNGMRQDFSWRQSAKRYLALYQELTET